MENNTRLYNWWKDNPSDPDRATPDNPDVQHVIAQIAQGAQATDLGGVMSLNVLLHPAELVLRVHQSYISRQRLLAVQEVRQRLAERGLTVPTALHWRDATLFRCGVRWAELEKYIPHNRLKHTFDSYLWLFEALGIVHRSLATLDTPVPRPLFATYAPPSSLFRWLPATEAAVQGDAEGRNTARLLRGLVRSLRRQWLSASELPRQLIHGDVRLSNVCQTAESKTLYLDFGFMAYRPRIYDVAYSLAFMFLALHGQQHPESFEWSRIRGFIEQYEIAANTRLSTLEKRALAPYAAAVPLYAAALAGFGNHPVELLLKRVPFMRFSEWLLAHPEALSAR